MNAVRKMILKRFLNRNMCFLRSPDSDYLSHRTCTIGELVKIVPNPEWWQVDEKKYNRLKTLIGNAVSSVGVLETGSTLPRLNPTAVTSVGTPGVYLRDILDGEAPLHVVRFEANGENWLFIPLHRPAIEKETIS